MNRVEVGDVFVEKDSREHGRILRVLAVYLPATYELDEGYVVCQSKRRVTVLSYERMASESRFTKYNKEVSTQSYGY